MFLLILACTIAPSRGAQDPSAAGATEKAPPSIRLEKTIELPDVAGRIDHLALDLVRRRLFVAALGNDSVEVVDLRGGVHEKSLKGFSEPRGVLVLDPEDRILVTNGGTGALDVIDGDKLEKVASVAIGPDADNLRHDPRAKLVVAGFGEGEHGGLAIVDTTGWKVVAKIPLGGHPESFQFDAKGERAFVNVPSKRVIAVVDLALRKVVQTWAIEGAEANYPMAIQGADRRLFVACRKPPQLLVIDPVKGRTFEALALSGDPDDVFLDEASSRVFVACGAGTIDVFDRRDLGKYAPLERIETRTGARTCLFSPGEEKLFVAAPRTGDAAAEIRVYDTRK